MASALTVDATSGRQPGVLENSALNLAGLVAGGALGAISGFITAKVLGAEGVGVLAVVFGLVEFGRGLTNFTHTPSILELHRGRDEGAVFGTSLMLKFIGAFLFVGLTALVAPRLANVFQVPAFAIVLTSMILFVGAFQEIGTARYEAANRMLMRNLLVTVGPAIGLLAVVLYVVADMYDVYTAISTSIIGTAAMSFGFFVHWKRPKFLWEPTIARYLLTYGGRLVLSSFLTQVLLWTDTLMISAILGNFETGIYNVVFQLTVVMVTASVGIGIALLPALSELASRGADTRHAYHRGTLLALGLSIAGAIIFIAVGRLVLGLYGPEFTRGYVPLLVLTVFGASAALAVPAQSMLTVHGRATTLLVLSAVQVALNVPLNYFLIQRHGILGASLATTAVFALGLVSTWLLVHRATGAWPLSRQTLGEAWGKIAARLR